MPVSPAIQLGQEEFEAIPDYIARPCLNPLLQKKKETRYKKIQIETE
jgi:hypothetical protein